jgi:hypothetical protein
MKLPEAENQQTEWMSKHHLSVENKSVSYILGIGKKQQKVSLQSQVPT